MHQATDSDLRTENTMPSSSVRSFFDPDDYVSAIRGTTAEFTIAGRGCFEAKLTLVDLHHMRLHRYTDNLPRVAYCIDQAGYSGFTFRTNPGRGLRRSGVEMLQTNIIRRGRAETYFQQSDGEAAWGTISLRIEEFASLEALVGSDLTPPKDALTITPPPVALGRLHRLHEAAGHLAEDAPTVLAHPEAARGFEQALVEAVAACLATDDTAEDRSAQRRHAKIMRRFYEAIEDEPDRAVFIPDLCAEIGVGERTLRICCQEYVGVSPNRLLMLRRMRQVRKALRESNKNTTTVTETAARWGFWNFGRFAGEYKSLFGELPSVTLARQ
jgi:AraC-like DNA-binding protein